MIQLEGVHKTYQRGEVEIQALRGIDLTIEDGALVAVMGPSGSGTSSLMNILGCLDVPTSGRYLLDGIDISLLPTRRRAEIRRRKFGYVFQEFNVVSRINVVRNVELPLLYAGVRRRRRPARRALQRVGLAERQKYMPEDLSCDQQHRLAIARALINNPAILLAEDPTSALDTAASTAIMMLLSELNEAGHTVIFTTHEEETARFATRVVRLLDGRVDPSQKQQRLGARPGPSITKRHHLFATHCE